MQIRSSFVFLPLIIALSVLTSGCGSLWGDDGYFADRSSDYLKAKESSPIILPEDKKNLLMRDIYVIPELEYAKVLPKKYEVPRIDSLDKRESKGAVRIQKYEEDQWILFQRSPGQTWPLLLKFLVSNQIEITEKNATEGILETGWLRVASLSSASNNNDRPEQEGDFSETTSNDGMLERYRFLLTHGVQNQTTEIRVVHEIKASVANVNERKENMMRVVAEHLASSPDSASHSLLAQGIGSASKVTMQYNEDGEPYLLLELPYARGWASLGLALQKSLFEIDDIDRSQGVYFARALDRKELKKKKKKGFFSRLFSRSSKEDGDNKNKSKKEKDSEQPLLVKAKEDKNGVVITVQRQQAPALESNEQAFFLRRILSNLS